MTERVQCAECERVYDSDQHPFCPRCGAMARGDPVMSARTIAGRNDPRRRRVQAAGVMMLVTGILVALSGIAFLATAGLMWDVAKDDETASTLVQMPTAVHVRVVDDASGLAGITVTLHGNETQEQTTDASGWANFTATDDLVVRLVIDPDGAAIVEEFILLNPGDADDHQVDVVADINDGIHEPQALIMEDAFVRTVRFLGVGALLLAVAPVLGGVAAVRLRRFSMAQTGAMLGGLPWLMLFIASMSILVLVILGLFIVAVVFVRQGRDLFT